MRDLAAQTMVPLAALASFSTGRIATQVNHEGGQVAVTVSFNLPLGGTLSSASEAIAKAWRTICPACGYSRSSRL